MTLSESIEAVGRMLSGYAQHKPEGSYIGTIASLLCTYPRIVASLCADPIRGVATITKFLPTVAEVVTWCEPHMDSLQRSFDMRTRAEAQLLERRRFDAEAAFTTPEERANVVDRFYGSLPEAFRTRDRKKASQMEIEAFKGKYGLTDSEWDAIPDQPANSSYWAGIRAPGALNVAAE